MKCLNTFVDQMMQVAGGPSDYCRLLYRMLYLLMCCAVYFIVPLQGYYCQCMRLLNASVFTRISWIAGESHQTVDVELNRLLLFAFVQATRLESIVMLQRSTTNSSQCLPALARGKPSLASLPWQAML